MKLLAFQMESMSYSFKLWSHPEKLLKDHITNVYENGRAIYTRVPINEELKLVLDLCLLLHDFGKSSRYFQTYIHAIHDHKIGRIDQEEFEGIKYQLGKYKNHARISAIWAFMAIEDLLKNPIYSLIGYITVLRHHGHLTNIEDMLEFPNGQFEVISAISEKANYEEYDQILCINGYSVDDFNHTRFQTKLNNFFNTRHFRRKWIKEIRTLFSPELFYMLSISFSILIAADKGECIFDGIIYKRSNLKLPPNLVDEYKRIKFSSIQNTELNKLRDQVYNSVNENILNTSLQDHFLSVNVPTGIGKTFTVINAALKLLDKRPDLEKIIYCLPFTSVIDQNATVLKDILNSNDIEDSSENLIVNHHLAELEYRPKTDADEIDENLSEFLITQFESNISVTTFYQFLYGIFTGQNNQLKKLHSFSNSVIILDEIQSIPSKYWPLLKDTLSQLATRLNITFIFVTATMPLIFSEADGEIKELAINKRAVFNSLNRIKLDSSLLQKPMQIDAFAELLVDDIETNPKKSFLIIVNTIKASKRLYKSLKEVYQNLIYLSTNIPPIERLRRIDNIKSAKEPVIVISTQLVEAGVDIDLDIVYRDIAPLDSIFQAAGRCNRNASGFQGQVKLCSLLDSNDKRFASYIYSLADLDITKELLTEKTHFEESEFFDLSNKYFETISKTPKDESEFILSEMQKLNYANAFDTNIHNSAFELIKNLPTYPAYIAYEEEASHLLNEYQLLIKSEFDNQFDKKRSIRNVLKKLSKYAVSVPEKYASNSDSFYFVISNDQMDFFYDKETGIELIDPQGVFI